MINKMNKQNKSRERKEWECNNKENKLRTNLLLFINKEIHQTITSTTILFNSRKPKDIIAEYEEYEIVINTPLIIGNKRSEVIVSDQYHRNLNKKQQSTVEYYFPPVTRKYRKKKIGHPKPGISRRSTASFSLSPKEDTLIKSPNDHLEAKKNKSILVLHHLAANLIYKPLPEAGLKRQATKHDTMGINECKIMRRLEQIIFREETTFYNDTNGIHAIDIECYNGTSRASTYITMPNYGRVVKRSLTEQLPNDNNEWGMNRMKS